LDRLFPIKDPLNRFKQIVGHVLAVQKPISINGLQKLYADGEEQGWTIEILSTMGSLLYGVSQADIPIRPLYSSFREFLTDINRSCDYFINLESKDYDRILACSTLRVMNTKLAFNMGQLKTSYYLNKEVENFEKGIQESLSPGLVYSVLHWAEHLVHIKNNVSPQLQRETRRLLEEKSLFWIESLSLLNQVHMLAPLLASAKRWILAVSVE
jgi:hypothetical protein